MKKFLAFFLIICIIFSLAGCSFSTELPFADNDIISKTQNENNTETINNDGNQDSAVLEARQQEYANLIIKTGIGLQKGQKLLIESQVENYEFTRICEEAAYEAGAADVIVYWIDAKGQRIKTINADDTAFEEYPSYLDKLYEQCLEEKIPTISLRSVYPGLMSDVDAELIARANVPLGPKAQAYNQALNRDEIAWCVAGVPNEMWAKTVFPDLPADEAVTKLWDTVLKTDYINGDGNGEELWTNHIDCLNNNAEKLNSKKIKTLHYTNSLGTDFTVDLPEDAIWITADATTQDGINFTKNLPTEEVYTAPLADSANGVIYASKPLVLNGTIINDIIFTVKDGKIIDSYASTGLEQLNKKLDTDEGSRYFGEISLVEDSSPISQTGLLFYATLYDENAACHIAFGFAFAECIEDGGQMSDTELKAAGLNTSNVHVDFMVGTPDLKIIGTTYDGEEIVIFENGNYAKGFLTE